MLQTEALYTQRGRIEDTSRNIQQTEYKNIQIKKITWWDWGPRQSTATKIYLSYLIVIILKIHDQYDENQIKRIELGSDRYDVDSRRNIDDANWQCLYAVPLYRCVEEVRAVWRRWTNKQLGHPALTFVTLKCGIVLLLSCHLYPSRHTYFNVLLLQLNMPYQDRHRKANTY